jgi:hypothetical protein
MHKSVLFVISVLLWHLTGQTQILPIQEARTLPVGTEVTITGIVTNGSELGIIRYMQDSTAGIAAYPGTGSVTGFAPLRGDSITVTGVLKLWNNLLEIDPITQFEIHSTGHPQPEPLPVSPSQIGNHIQSRIVRIDGISFINSGNFAGSTNYNYTVNGESGVVRISSESSLVGTPIPDKMVNIKGIMSVYQSTFQLLLRDASDIEWIDFSTNPFISVLYDNKSISSGIQLFRFDEEQTSLTIRNFGEIHPLIIQSLLLTGPQSGSYSVSGMPQEVDPLQEEEFALALSPSVSDGSHRCTLQIFHNGQGANPFLVNVYTIKGNLATAPVSQPENLVFTNLNTFGFNISFDHANPAPEGYIILRKKGGEIAGVPGNGISYKRGDYIGDAQVAYTGNTLTNYKATNIQAENDYYFKIFSFNGPAGYQNYLTENPLSGSIRTPASSPGDYYEGISSNSTSLINQLHNKINNRTTVSYYDYRNTMVPDFVSRDTTDGRRVITCVYSRHKYVYTSFEWWSTGDLSREHTYAHSWMPTNPADGNYWYGIPEKPEYNDQHNLFPTHHLNANARRSNYPLGMVKNISYQYLDGKLGTDVSGKQVYEPRDSHKGDAARALFYMATAYKDNFGNLFGLPANQDQELLKEWHLNDLPDNWELSRNDYISSLQENRNPFIDFTEFACFINFHTMQYISHPGGVCTGVVNVKPLYKNTSELKVFPNPFTESVQIEFNETAPAASIKISDIGGKVVYNEFLKNVAQGNVAELSLGNLPAGIYIMSIQSQKELFIRKLIKL